MATTHDIVSPVHGEIYKTVRLSSAEEAAQAVEKAHNAFPTWRNSSIKERVRILTKFLDVFVARKDELGQELAWLMGRPVRYSEIGGFEERARYMISASKECLEDQLVEKKEGFDRFIRKEPLGVIFIIAAWNYPYLISVNGVVPALLAGNVVILKQAPQTFPCSERLAEAFQEAGLPDGVFQYLHVDHPTAATIIRNPKVNHVLFTGSVEGGRAVQKTASDRFIGVGLELGGKDAAYVREDADITYAAENIVDGAMYNSGQSCCGIERVYVHAKVYDEFVRKAVDIAKQYKLGDPLSPDTTLGPVVRKEAANVIRKQLADAVAEGAKLLIDEKLFPEAKEGTAYVAPQILADVTHDMDIMKVETFGPVFGVMKVQDDEHAVSLINDSDYGLTASVWTRDVDAALKIGDRLEVGTFFMNRCDYLDPALAWTGVKESGRGCSLSKLVFDHLTRPKSFHIRR